MLSTLWSPPRIPQPLPSQSRGYSPGTHDDLPIMYCGDHPLRSLSKLLSHLYIWRCGACLRQSWTVWAQKIGSHQAPSPSSAAVALSRRKRGSSYRLDPRFYLSSVLLCQPAEPLRHLVGELVRHSLPRPVPCFHRAGGVEPGLVPQPQQVLELEHGPPCRRGIQLSDHPVWVFPPLGTPARQGLAVVGGGIEHPAR